MKLNISVKLLKCLNQALDKTKIDDKILNCDSLRRISF